MQQLILLLTSFLLGCGFPAFLIGFYSIRIWESHLLSLSMSFVGSDSSGSGHERSPDLNAAGTEIGIVERRPINLVERLLRLSFLPPGRRF
jgi:hypothetical protein